MADYRDRRWNPRAWRGACGALAALILMGCGPQATVSRTWNEPTPAGVPFGNVLVVGISSNSRMRRSFEQELSNLITAGRSKASASIQVGSATRPLSPEAVADMVRATGADAVLVTRLVNRKVALVAEPDRVGVKTQQPASLSDGPGLVQLFSQEYNEYEEPGELTARSTAVIESSLYQAVDGGRLVYRITTTAKFKEDTDDVIGAVTSAIAKQLKRDGLIH